MVDAEQVELGFWLLFVACSFYIRDKITFFN